MKRIRLKVLAIVKIVITSQCTIYRGMEVRKEPKMVLWFLMAWKSRWIVVI